MAAGRQPKHSVHGLVILAGLLLATLYVYVPVLTCGFVAFDDGSYVTGEPMVNQGVRSAAILWAFTATQGANWHPLTSLSHMLDCSLFGLNPHGHHATSLLLHALNAGLVFAVWRRMVGRLWPSAFVALWFALHPLNVESVAWIAQRKNLLSTTFWLFTIWTYVAWTEGRGRWRYALVVLSYLGALMTKPMAVTVPLTLLLLDYWPLRRTVTHSLPRLLLEKAPLMVMAAALSVVTYFVQVEWGATDYGVHLTFADRAANALVSCLRYGAKFIFPAELSCLYPHPARWSLTTVLAACGLLGAVTALAWRCREKQPWVAFGWAWFLTTLLPVSGLIQVGAQAIADRYMYVPMLGLLTAGIWSVASLAGTRAKRLWVMSLMAISLAVAFAVRTRAQLRVWKDAESLIAHAMSVAGQHPNLQLEMCKAVQAMHRPEAVVEGCLKRGLELYPEHPFFVTEAAFREAQNGNFDRAVAMLEQVRRQLPKEWLACANLGNLYRLAGRFDKAEAWYREGLRLRPQEAKLFHLLASVYAETGRAAEAGNAQRRAVALNRWDWEAILDLGVWYYYADRYSDAIACFEKALWINPGSAKVKDALKTAKERVGRPAK